MGIVLLCCAVVAAGGYAAYRLRLRSMMQVRVQAKDVLTATTVTALERN